MRPWQEIIDKYYPEGTSLRDIYLNHCRSVADLALTLNRQQPNPLEEHDIETAAMLHDIGIFLTDAPSIACQGKEPYIRHGVLGGDILRREGCDEKYARVCERHTGVGISEKEVMEKNLRLPNDRTYMPISRLERLICYADKFFSKSGDGSKKSIEEAEKSVARFGKENIIRFQELREEFEPKNNSKY